MRCCPKGLRKAQGMKSRLDQILFHRKMAETREKARALILAGKVWVDGQRVDKAGALVAEDSHIRISEAERYVSRGGYKLEAALKAFPISLQGKTVMDVGASTGGFTDCLLQHGAEKVIAVDVGYGQLHQRLREDPRVVVVERTNARYLTAQDLPGIIHGATIDVSFISVTLLARPVSCLLEDKAFVIVLVKPQFEVGRAKVKKGVVKDPSLHQEAVEKVKESFLALGWEEIGVIPSPILGPKGNKEFLLGLKR